jgi:hypothetical protein
MADMTDQAPEQQSRGDVFLDARGKGRALRLRWHPEADIVVLSLWREGTCAGTFRMPHADVGVFIDTLIDGLRDVPGVRLRATDDTTPGPAVRADESGPITQTDALPVPEAVPEAKPAFTEWAFGRPERDDRATAS